MHVSQICNDRVEKVSDVLKEGDMVKVKVLEVDKQGRIRLSMKAVEEGEGSRLLKAVASLLQLRKSGLRPAFFSLGMAGRMSAFDPKGPVATVRYWANWSLAYGARPKVGFLLTFDYRCMVGARSIERI